MAPKVVITTVPKAPYEGTRVAEQLKKTMTRLTEAESNKSLFTRMIAKGVATNDVRNFALKQADAKKADKKLNGRLVKCSMKSKLADTCALIKKLRYDKINLTKKLSYEMRQEKWRFKRIKKSLNKEAKMHRVECDVKNFKKMKSCSHKM